MSVDPRRHFTVRNCAKSNTSNAADQARRKTFLESITKVGDLEILNDVGFGGVAEGLRVLASVADSARVGQSAVPGREQSDLYNSTLGAITNTALNDADAGARAVLDTMGLGSALDAVSSFQPEVANRAYGQAKSIFERVKQGNFDLSDIPNVFQDLQNLEQLAKGVATTAKTPIQTYEMCGASPYAMDLISYAPKFNFLFVVDVQFAPEYEAWTGIGRHMAFVVKRSTRPAVEFEYEEVNMYNFWTRVPKRVQYPPVTMAFYDDNKNAAHLFYTAYTRAMSPIANVMQTAPGTNDYEVNSMNFDRRSQHATFDSSSPLPAGHSASLGALAGNAKSIVSRIRLFHIFDYGRLMNIYNFYNPRILTFTPSDLNMAETGEGAEFEFQFAYDGMFIEPGFSIQEGGDNKNIDELTGNAGAAKYPIRPVFGDDDVPQQDNSQQGLAPIAQADDVGSAYSATTLGSLSNVSSGVTGAINDNNAQNSVISNAFRAVSDFTGSLFS